MISTAEQSRKELPDNWIQVSLGNPEYFELIMGQSPSSETYTAKKTGLPFLQGNADFGTIHPNPKTYCTEPMKIAEKNDVLISVRAPVGEVNIATERYCIGRGLGAIRSKEKYDSKYLYYYISHYRHDLERISAGSTFKAITKDDLEKFSVTLPPTDEKQKIVSILTTLDDAIQRSRQAAAETERFKAGVMHELITKGIGHTKFREDPNIGMVPNEWGVKKLGEISDIVSGGTPSRTDKNFWNGNIPWIKTGEIRYNIINNSEEKITKAGLENSAARIIPKGTLLMALYGQGVTRGRVAITGIEATINQACAAIMFKEDIDTKFIFYFLSGQYESIRSLSGGSNQNNLNIPLIKSVPISIPPLAEQQQIAAILSSLDDKITLQRQRTAHYEKLKQGLMNELLTGKRRVMQNTNISIPEA